MVSSRPRPPGSSPSLHARPSREEPVISRVLEVLRSVLAAERIERLAPGYLIEIPVDRVLARCELPPQVVQSVLRSETSRVAALGASLGVELQYKPVVASGAPRTSRRPHIRVVRL